MLVPRVRKVHLVLAGSICVAGLIFLVAAADLNQLYHRDDALPHAPPHGIVVLSSGVDSRGALDVSAQLRLEEGLRLAASYPGALLLTTRVANAESGVTSDSAQQSLVVKDSAIARRWLTIPGVVRSTREEALAARRFLTGPTHLVVVTTSAHSGRACASFEQVGFVVSCRGIRIKADRPWDPAYEFIYETLASTKYRFKGWME
jgi:uncharacterized SAM-binding protein YcdF (DUF218 family)